MTTLHWPHPSERLSVLAGVVVQAFWVVALGIILMYGFFLVLGAIDPGDAAPLSATIGALLLLGAARSWAGAHRARERDPGLIRARERRGF